MADRPDWHAQVLIKGQYGTTLVPIGTDEEGNLLCIVKGDYAGALTTVAVDVDGVLQTNITRQGLDWLRTRPVYGQGRLSAIAAKSCPDGATTTLLDISGQGAVLGGTIRVEYLSAISGVRFFIYVDDTLYYDQTLSDMLGYGYELPGHAPLFLLTYDPVNFKYAWGLMGGLTFETSITISFFHTTGAALSLYADLYHALVP